jgi:hypothetical protein
VAVAKPRAKHTSLRGFLIASRSLAQFGHIDTSDLFTEVSRGIHYQLWLVESHRSR